MATSVLRRAWRYIHEAPKAPSYEDFKEQGGRILHPQSNWMDAHYLALAQKQPKELPSLLMAKGCMEALSAPKRVAIVGLRAGAVGQLRMAKRLAQYLVRAGFVVVSGYARGVDVHAHWGALEEGGKTIMVLPHAMQELLWDPEGAYLRKELRMHLSEKCLMDNALWLSQFSFSQEYTRYTPLHRNKVLCALSSAVVVACSLRGSGSYQAAKTAKRMGQEVFVWRPKRNYPEGNRLLAEKYHARPFADAEDLMDKLERVQRSTALPLPYRSPE